MRDNRKDRTIERNYTQKWRFLIAEYQLVKAEKRPKFRFAQDFYAFHGVNRQTFFTCYNRHLRRPFAQIWRTPTSIRRGARSRRRSPSPDGGER